MLVSVLALALTAGPSTLAASGLNTVGVDDKSAAFFVEYLAQELARIGAPKLKVVSAAQVAAVLGAERQKQLLGCGNDECNSELAGALAADWLLNGSIARLGERYSVSLTVVVAATGERLASATEGQLALDELPPYLSRAAQQLVDQLFGGKSAVAPVASTTQDNLLRFSFAGVEYDRRLSGSLWVGAQLNGYGLLYDPFHCNTSSPTSCTTQFLGQALAVVRFHPLDRDTRLAWGIFGAVGANAWWSKGFAGAAAQLGGEIGWRWVRVSLAVTGEFTPRDPVAPLRLGLMPTLTFALPF